MNLILYNIGKSHKNRFDSKIVFFCFSIFVKHHIIVQVLNKKVKIKMHIKVSEQGSEETGVNLILDVNGCISLDYLERYFTGATGLKYLDADSGRWT